MHVDNTDTHVYIFLGIIDSALLRDKTSTGKEFVLRDEQDSIPCVFYEIVSPLIILAIKLIHSVLLYKVIIET